MDPISHPSLFFRKVGDPDDTTSLASFHSKIVRLTFRALLATANGKGETRVEAA
jgi:hypothetical protein